MKKNKKYIAFLNTFTFRQWVLFYIGILLVLGSGLAMLYTIQKNNLTTIPVYGGVYKEGIVGTLRFINPVLAVSENEKEITNLIFRGLFTKDKMGVVTPLFAKSYTISEDGLMYTVTLKDDIYFQNKEKVTTEDVLYTINQIKDPLIKSPKQTTFAGVDVKIISPEIIEFKLKQRYSDFLDILSVGILSKNEWKNVTNEEFSLSEKNINPVGNGPYMFVRMDQNKGIPQKITLGRNKKYTDGKPYIKKIEFSFFDTEKNAINALNSDEITTLVGISPENAALIQKKNIIEKSPSFRFFGLFFNTHTEPIFQDHKVIEALEYAIDKKEIIEKVFSGYALEREIGVPSLEKETTIFKDTKKAGALLEKAGWRKNNEGIWEKNKIPLKFTITTTDIEELKLVNILIQEQLRSFGVEVLIKTYETTTFSQQVLNERNYQVVLFGQFISKPNNLYAFWHSNERNAPGLNITMYANHKIDTLLDKLKKEIDTDTQKIYLNTLVQELNTDKPVIYLFEPMYISASSKKIFNRTYNTVFQTSRFSNVHLWSIKTDHVWKLFKK